MKKNKTKSHFYIGKEIRSLRQERFDAIKNLDKKRMKYSWKKGAWSELLQCPDNYLLHELTLDKELIGFSLYLVEVKKPLSLHLLKVVLGEAWEGKGLARKMFEDLVEFYPKLEQIYLEVEAENTRAIGLYETTGFEKLRLLKKYYSDQSDALSMLWNRESRFDA
ncbi:MAG: GNAT family N-acetyltransferase [Halobacteriovoraceae bacterium]|nr:GNAT family N-acetyltransferase [Halobacteriovoraceae bacterium]MCB9095711.1 GNAT family N-acetyltransferase [Halobacteriovoraceae bacterium]